MHKRPVKGTGLGLSIVKTVLDKHGFSCGVKSADGGGSVFFVVFPVLKEETDGLADGGAASENGGAASGNG